MPNLNSGLNSANSLTALAGANGQQIDNATYINPNGNKVSFHVLPTAGVPAGRYLAGAVSSYNLIKPTAKNDPTKPPPDPNLDLYQTKLTATSIAENIERKVIKNRIPYTNYDQIVDIGIAGQTIVLNAMFYGTQYQQGFKNLVNILFDNSTSGLGTLMHPFYGKIENVLPIKVGNTYSENYLNCIIVELTFLTTDIKHLFPKVTKESKLKTIAKFYQGIQNAVTSTMGLIASVKSLINNTISGIVGNSINNKLNTIVNKTKSQTAFFYQKIPQTVFNNNDLKNFNINYTLLLPSSKYINNLNNNQINSQMEDFIKNCNDLTNYINTNIQTYNKLLFQQIINNINLIISQLNNFATSLLNSNNNIINYTTTYNMSMTEAMYNNNINLDDWQIQIKYNSHILDYNNIEQNTKLFFVI